MATPITPALQRGLLALVLAAFASQGVAQTNLLINGDFETDAGFKAADEVPDCQDFWGNFCGWPGWNTDFADDGEFNGSWTQDSPGGLRLANTFPSGADPTDQVLTGDRSAFALGAFDPGTSTVLLQQVAANAGDELRFGLFSYSDSTRLREGSNFPDTVYGQFSQNKFRMRAEFFDFLGFGNFTEDTEAVIYDPANDPGFDVNTFSNPLFEDQWIETVITVTVPSGADFARLAILFDQVNNAGGIAFFDTASIVNLSAGTPLDGDLDFDGGLDGDDLRMLSLAVDGDLAPADGPGGRFDLTGDGSLTAADVAALQALLPGLDGDYNGDGVVDGADYTLWRDGGPLQNESVTPGSVTIEDYDAWVANFGATSASGATAIPEPASVLIAAVALGCVCRRTTR